MALVGIDKARQGFEELLADAWAMQVARSDSSPDPRDRAASGDDRLNAQAPESKWQAAGSGARKEKMA